MSTNEMNTPPFARVRFPRISPRAYEHPADRAAMATLRAVPGVTEGLKAVSGLFTERGERLLALASAIRVGPAQFPGLDRMRAECAEILDLPSVPNVFVTRCAEPDAFTLGIDEPFIVLTTGLVEALDTASLRFALGHEMGHVLSGHAVLRIILVRLLNLQVTVTWLPAGSLGLRAVIAALCEWFRKAELTADRAGLLCTQDPAAALERMNHPFAVVRAAELQRWAAGEEYRDILGGDFPRRDDGTGPTLADDLASAGRFYRDRFGGSTDPLANAFADIGTAMSDTARNIRTRFGLG